MTLPTSTSADEPPPQLPPFRRHRKQRVPVELIVRRLLEGARTRALAIELGCNHGYIARIRSRYGIPNPPSAPHQGRPVEQCDFRARRCHACGGLSRGAAARTPECGRCGAPW